MQSGGGYSPAPGPYSRGVCAVRLASLILGVIGGLFGLGGAVFALFVGGLGSAFGAEGAETVTGLGFAAIPLAILGIIGGAIAMSKPKAAAWLQLISAIGGLIAISAAYAIAFVCLLVGAILAWVSARHQPPAHTGAGASA